MINHTMDMVGESGNLFILSLDSPCAREGEMGFSFWPEVGLLKELAAAVEGAHVVDALATSPLPPEQTHVMKKGNCSKTT